MKKLITAVSAVSPKEESTVTMTLTDRPCSCWPEGDGR